MNSAEARSGEVAAFSEQGSLQVTFPCGNGGKVPGSLILGGPGTAQRHGHSRWVMGGAEQEPLTQSVHPTPSCKGLLPQTHGSAPRLRLPTIQPPSYFPGACRRLLCQMLSTESSPTDGASLSPRFHVPQSRNPKGKAFALGHRAREGLRSPSDAPQLRIFFNQLHFL